MSEKLLVPDIGDFEEVEIIEILVKEGDKISKNDPVITLESDKSSVEVPSAFEGVVDSINIKIGDKVSKGDLILTLSSENGTQQKQEIIEVNIAIESRDKQIINATNVVNKNISKIVQIAEEIGIEKDQIVTSEFSITPVTRWVEKKDEFGEYGESQIIAYKVYNSVIVTSEDKDNITTFIDRANLETGNSFRVNNIRFKAKFNDENKVLAREKAVEDALEKADFYEKELGIKLGKIISFEEFQPGLPSNKSSYDMPMMRMSAAEAMPSTELFAGESEIVSEIYIGFEIE